MKRLRLIKTTLKDYPDKTQARLNLGMIYLESQQYQNSIDTLAEVIREENQTMPMRITIRAGRGPVCKQWEKAKTCYEKAIAIDQQYAAAYFNRALSFCYQKANTQKRGKITNGAGRFPATNRFHARNHNGKATNPYQN